MRSVLVALALASIAGAWPKPAGGPSASGGPEVILTFDDGPHEVYTAQILDELDRRGLRATFFWVGHRVTGGRRRVADRIDVAQRALREGHLIGNHTIDHAQLCSGTARDAAHQIDDNRDIFERLFGMPISLFRAPYGARCTRLERMLRDRELAHFHWDIDPREWLSRDAAATAEYVIRKLRHLDGRAVILLHDTKEASARALPRVLDWIEAENARRARRGLQPIRILSHVDLARERLAPGLEDWLATAAGELRDVRAALPRVQPVAPTRAARAAPVR